MADEIGTKVSQLPLGENLADDDLMYAVENGISKKVEVSYLQNRIVGDVDSTPTASSDNLVTSGGVYNMVHTLDFNVFHDLAQISNSIADAFSVSESYSEGDYVVYDYSLYKFTADKSAGAWDFSKATPVAVVEELGSGGTTVVPNPSGEATDTLEKLRIDQTIYDFAASNVYGEASGAIASFSDGSNNPLVKLEVDINPVQAGSGTPSPSNIRPISGWSSVEVTVAGKNVLPTKFYNGIGYNISVGTELAITELDDVTQSGNTYSRNVRGWHGFGMITHYLPNGTYYLSSYLESPSMRSSIYVIDSNMKVVRNLGNVASGTTRTIANSITLSGNEHYIAFSCLTSTDGTVKITEPQVTVGSTATSYEAYNADTETISLGQTVYGGTLNVTTGELTVTDGYIASYDGETLPSTWISDRDVYAEGTTPTVGAEVVYKLATPTTVTLTPTQVDSLLGNNNIWADSGDSDVVYIRNLNLFLNQLDARVKALENA